MGGQNREGIYHQPLFARTPVANEEKLGGKIKPLKAPKKQNKDLDDEDKAFLEKKKAGT
jgi:hypothetical protein